MIQFDSSVTLYVLYFIGFIILPVFVIASLSKRNNVDSGFLDVNTTNWMRGICAVIIVIGHFQNHLLNSGFLKLYSPITGYAVSIFLGLSGYALEKKMVKENDYLHGFIKKRITRIYLPWFTTTIFLCVLFSITKIETILRGLFTFQTVYREKTYNWYIICILMYYFLFFLAGIFTKSIKDKNKQKYLRHGIIFLGSMLWIVFCILKKMPSHWYNNGLCFYAGILLFSIKGENRTQSIKMWIRIVLSFSFLSISGISYIISQLIKNYLVASWLIWDIGGISFFIFAIVSCSFVAPRNKKWNIFMFIGKESLEVFLLATGLILKYYNVFNPNFLSPILSLIAVFIISTIFYYIDFLLSKLLLHYLNHK